MRILCFGMGFFTVNNTFHTHTPSFHLQNDVALTLPFAFTSSDRKFALGYYPHLYREKVCVDCDYVFDKLYGYLILVHGRVVGQFTVTDDAERLQDMLAQRDHDLVCNVFSER